MPLSATASNIIHITASQTATAAFGDNVVENFDQSLGDTFASGTGSGNIDVFYRAQRTLTQGANETLNLNNASLTNGLGNTIAMTSVKAIYVKNTSTTLTLAINGAASTIPLTSANTETINVPPGGTVYFSYPVGWVSTVNTSLKFAASAGSGSLTYNLMVQGV